MDGQNLCGEGISVLIKRDWASARSEEVTHQLKRHEVLGDVSQAGEATLSLSARAKRCGKLFQPSSLPPRKALSFHLELIVVLPGYYCPGPRPQEL